MSELAELIANSAGLPSAFRKNQPVGTTWAGKIVRVDVRQTRDDDGNPEVWDDGKPRQQIVVAIQTDVRDPERPNDDGVRGVYIKFWGEQRRAFLDAMQAAGATDLEVGGTFAAQYTGDGEQPKNKMMSPAKLYRYEYKAPSPTAGLLGSAMPATQPATTYAQPAAQPTPQAAPQPAPAAQQTAPAPETGDPTTIINQVKSFIAVGMNDAQIAVALNNQLAPEAIAAIRAAG